MEESVGVFSYDRTLGILGKIMKRSLLVLGFLALCLFGASCLLPESQAQQSSSQNYLVQYGDTLWDIAADQLNDPSRWRDIHRNNPQIVNPNLIYPGDVLGLDVSAAMGKMQRRSDKVIARPWYGLPAPVPKEVAIQRPPNPIVPSADFIESSGYIVPYSIKELLDADFAQVTGVEVSQGETTHIIKSEYGQLGLVFGDTIYINKGSEDGVKEGDVLLAFRPKMEIYHPITEELMGTQLDILGRLRVKTLEPHISAAEIITSYNYIQVGEGVMPVSEISIPLEKPLAGNSRSYGLKVGNQLIGHIIGERINRPGLSYGDIVYLDVGAAQGVQPADSLIIYREIGEGFPRQAIGRVQVLSVQKQTATALITESVKTILPGEKVVLKR